jgi:hypothetical protein
MGNHLAGERIEEVVKSGHPLLVERLPKDVSRMTERT